MEFKDGQKVELNALGKERVDRGWKRRTGGECRGRAKKYPESYWVKWEAHKSIEIVHQDFLTAAPK